MLAVSNYLEASNYRIKGLGAMKCGAQATETTSSLRQTPSLTRRVHTAKNHHPESTLLRGTTTHPTGLPPPLRPNIFSCSSNSNSNITLTNNWQLQVLLTSTAKAIALITTMEGMDSIPQGGIRKGVKARARCKVAGLVNLSE